jgi:hypothetical protein
MDHGLKIVLSSYGSAFVAMGSGDYIFHFELSYSIY